jgi:FtsH-binding integral membrane protein
LALVLVVLSQLPTMTIQQIMITACGVIFGLFSLGMFQENKTVAKFSEIIKWAIWGAFITFGPIQVASGPVIAAIWIVISAIFFYQANLSHREQRLVENQTS